MNTYVETIQMPVPYCPFPSRVNPHVKAVQKHTDEWVNQWSLIKDDSAYRRYCACQFAWLTARAYPDTGFDELAIASDWFTSLFLLDDPVDESVEGTQSAQLSNLFEKLLALLRNLQSVSTKYSPLAASWIELWNRLRERTTVQWQQRFTTAVGDYFNGCIWEAENRATKSVPGMTEYSYWRPFTSAIYTTFELIDVTEHIDLPTHVREHDTIKCLSFMANNVISWYNDLISLPKEIKRGDVQNLVLVLQNENQLTLQDAVFLAAQKHDNEVRAFMESEQHLPIFGEVYDAQVASYVQVLKYWMRGNVDWSDSSVRYQEETLPVKQESTYIELTIHHSTTLSKLDSDGTV
jgi:5-epi-alpha-selinene synthase